MLNTSDAHADDVFHLRLRARYARRFADDIRTSSRWPGQDGCLEAAAVQWTIEADYLDHRAERLEHRWA